MGLLRRKSDGHGVFLRAQHAIGRDADNHTVIARAAISSRHAVVAWTTSGWVLKDTSKYGTIVNGALVKGSALPLNAGDLLTFVEADEVWVLESSAPPGLLLTPIDAAKPLIHVDYDTGLLALPSEEAPQHTLLQLGDAWLVEDETGTRRRLVDGATLELCGVEYRVAVPPPLVQTAEPENPASPFSLDIAELEIGVLRGEDEAEVTIRCGGIARTVKASRPLYLLAYLAEQRAKATADEGGWISTDLACADLAVDRAVLNVDVHRVREAVKATRLVDGANIVERRPSQIRIGVAPSRCTIIRR